MNGMSVAMGPHRYVIRADESHDMHLHADDARGHCHADRLTLCVDSRLPLSVQRDTVLHELLHAAWNQAGLNALTDTLPDGTEELVVSSLSTLLLDALLRNPALMEFLTA